MPFNSLAFLAFFPLTAFGYYLLPARYRMTWLLVASYVFYALGEPAHLITLVACTIVTFWAGLRMAERDRADRRPILVVAIAFNLGCLVGFKYIVPLAITTSDPVTVGVTPPGSAWPLAVGLSFFVFQLLGYAIDVSLARVPAERRLDRFALFVAFFPQLVSGPIERAGRLLPQFGRRVSFDGARVAGGLRRMLWGFFKKLVVADRLAVYVDAVYRNPDLHPGWPMVLATYLYAIQIYADLSGYTDIALGAGRVFGIELTENFRRPFAAKSVADFWRRWHVSMSSWFFDYLYAPIALGIGRWRRRAPRWWGYTAVFLTFLAIGVWHGAGWGYVLFGVWVGSVVSLGMISTSTRDTVWRRFPSLARRRPLWQSFATVHLLLVAVPLFRGSGSGSTIGDRYDALMTYPEAVSLVAGTGMGAYELGLAGVGIAILIATRPGSVLAWDRLESSPRSVRWVLTYMLLFAILMFGRFGRTGFVYHEF